MFTTTQLAFRYLKFLYRASNSRGHGVHSPFVFDLLIHVLQDKTDYNQYASWMSWRNSMLSSQEVLEIEEIGAGSRSESSSTRSIASLARVAAKSPRTARFFFSTCTLLPA